MSAFSLDALYKRYSIFVPHVKSNKDRMKLTTREYPKRTPMFHNSTV